MQVTENNIETIETSNVNPENNSVTIKKIRVKKDAKKDAVKKESLGLVNLDKAKESLKKLGIIENEVATRGKNEIYLYPENVISDKAKKAFRVKQREKLKNLVQITLVHNAYNRKEDLKNSIVEFQKMYKEIYRINDFSVLSVTQSSNEVYENQLKAFFELVKSGATTSKTKKK